jgi:hypothetical protein
MFSKTKRIFQGERHATTRPHTVAGVNADCQHYGRPAQGNLTIRKVYGQD